MQLSPLQSRLAASVLATCLLIILYFSLFSPQFAFAEELNDASPIQFEEAIVEGLAGPELEMRDGMYEPEFIAFDRSILGRAPPGVEGLVNNNPVPMNVEPGTTKVFVFESAQIFGRDSGAGSLELRGEQNGSEERSADGEKPEDSKRVVRRATKTVYISANTCQQPDWISPTTMDPPQLTLYVSTSSENLSPGPSADMGQQQFQVFNEGAVMFNVTASDDVYIGVSAPTIDPEFFSGIYNFKVAASTDGHYFSYDESSEADLVWVDSDASAALLITHNLTTSTDEAVDQQVMSTEPYVMFAQNDQDRSISGLRYSYCGLTNYAQIAAVRNGKFASMVTTGMTRRGAGNFPKQQFYFSGLNASTNYAGILARNTATATDSIGAGGHVFRATNFTTKSQGGNCAVVFNLTFCDEVAYAVPSNNNTFPNTTLLANFYDDFARDMYSNFEKNLAQIQCEAESAQKYSLVRNCTHCADAYKAWLCSVTIPRCEDFAKEDSYLWPRAITQPFPDKTTLSQSVIDSILANKTGGVNTSRIARIDDVVKPGPYKEVLPCEDLCYNIVQSCPASLGFSCPQPGMIGFDQSYGQRTEEDSNGLITCNYPGSAHYFSSSALVSIPWVTMTLAASLMAVVLL